MFIRVARSMLFNSTNRGFVLGFGSVGVAWLLRRRLGKVAVAGTKEVYRAGTKVNRYVDKTKHELSGVVEEAKIKNLQVKLDKLNLDLEEREKFQKELSHLSEKVNMLERALTEKK